MFEIESVESKNEIVEALRAQRIEIGDYLDGFPIERFLTPQGDKWSPEGHLRHLVKSVRAVTGGLRIPKLLLAARFGISWRGSRSFDEVKQVYLGALDAGAKAGRFGPSGDRPELPPEEWKDIVFERWRSSGEELVAAIAPWSEKALDHYRLPHPLLGKLTVREMLFFTLYHNGHHARRINERVPSE
ncbi:MAG: DinB family protein [Acidobacteriota bacterium]|nr:DinB family protein [Acidobacteriota bacterium]